jgi:hypothetical protein
VLAGRPWLFRRCPSCIKGRRSIALEEEKACLPKRIKATQVTRVNLANVLDEGLRIRGRGRQMNSKVKTQTNKAIFDVCLRISL